MCCAQSFWRGEGGEGGALPHGMRGIVNVCGVSGAGGECLHAIEWGVCTADLDHPLIHGGITFSTKSRTIWPRSSELFPLSQVNHLR